MINSLLMRGARFWAFLILSSLTILVLVFLVWEITEKSFFRNIDYETLHYIYVTRGATTSLILAAWAIWFVWNERLAYRDKLAKIVDNSTDAILVFDEWGKFVAINRQASSMLDCPTGVECRTIYDILPPEERDGFVEKMKLAKAGHRITDHEMEKTLCGRKRIPVSIGLVYIKEDKIFIESVRDIRERVALRNKIMEIEKAHVIGKMAEGIAHHMGTPLSSMLLRVQMLKEDIPNSRSCESCTDKLNQIERQIFYSKSVIERLLRFARRGEDRRRPENLSTLVDEAVEIIRPILTKRGIRLTLDIEEGVRVLANGNLLELVLSDIMMNAVDAMPEGGTMSIKVSSKAEGIAEIVITDTGVGISQDILPFVFEPFFTTKPAGKGTGLGLSVGKSIIHDHGGDISIESTEGKGTSVFVRLPICSEDALYAQV